MPTTRRDFLAAAGSSLAASLGPSGEAQTVNGQQGAPAAEAMQHDHAMHSHPKPKRPAIPRLPAVLCRTTATASIDAAYDMLLQGKDTLDAALHVTQMQEDGPNDSTAGLGGLPTSDGKVHLDACCLHGPTRRSATVGTLTGIRNASLVAHKLMETTGYPLLAGEDATRFAIASGFTQQDLSTDRTRKIWALWKKIQALPKPLGPGSFDPAWPGPPDQTHFLSSSQHEIDALIEKFEPLAAEYGLEPQQTWRAAFDCLFPSATPLYVATVNSKQELSSASTTSGMPWRLPGAVSDVAVLGSGAWLDPDVGSAGASGSAAANIEISGAHLIVENMRRGMSPEDAGMDALRRIAAWHGGDMQALRFVEVVYYVLRKDGAYGCVSLWRGDRTGHVRQFTIHDGARRSEDCLYLFNGSPANGVK